MELENERLISNSECALLLRFSPQNQSTSKSRFFVLWGRDVKHRTAVQRAYIRTIANSKRHRPGTGSFLVVFRHAQKSVSEARNALNILLKLTGD